MIKCVVIDDEPLAIQLLADYIVKTPYLKLAGTFEEPLQALPLINEQSIDLLFLDISMPDISGVDFYKSLKSKPSVIFTTAYSEYAINGFELNAVDYLLKPISFEKFITATNKVKELKESRKGKGKERREYFFINVSHKLHKIFYNDILYLEGFKDYTKIYLAGVVSPLLILHNLKYFEELFDDTEFIRIHRSYIVSIGKLDTVSRKSVTISNQLFPVSDNYRDRFLHVVEQYTS